jgi:hypothetical protein
LAYGQAGAVSMWRLDMAHRLVHRPRRPGPPCRTGDPPVAASG